MRLTQISKLSSQISKANGALSPTNGDHVLELIQPYAGAEDRYAPSVKVEFPEFVTSSRTVFPLRSSAL